MADMQPILQKPAVFELGSVASSQQKSWRFLNIGRKGGN